VDGGSLAGTDEFEVRARVGLISHHSMLYAALTAEENVEFAARLYGVEEPRRSAREALDRLAVGEHASVMVRKLSRGLQQRVSIARALVHRPRVLLLDEPYTGLDAVGARALTDALVALLSEGTAMILVTHHLDEGLALATSVAVMRGGRLVRVMARAEIDPLEFAATYRELIGEDGSE